MSHRAQLAALDAFFQPVHQHLYCFGVVRGRHRAGESFGFGRAFHHKRGLRQPNPLDPALQDPPERVAGLEQRELYAG
jgi:hypothetical protein